MSIYNKPEMKIKMGNNTPSHIHKKNNSLNFSSTSGRFIQDNNKYLKNRLQLKNEYNNNNTVNNILTHNNTNSNQNLNQIMSSTNKNRIIEINLNKNNSPLTKMNKSLGENNIIFLRNPNTSKTNLNSKIPKNDSNNNNKEECNIIINNNINNDKNQFKNKSSNNINININISKKVYSTYFNKTKYGNSNEYIRRKKSVNSIGDQGIKEMDNKKNYNDKEDIKQNQNNSNKISLNYNSLGLMSTTSNMSTNTNKNNRGSKNNICINKSGYSKNALNNNTYNDIYNINNDKEDKKNSGNIISKIIKENKSIQLSQIQVPMNSSNSPRNINSLQNYIKYLNIGKENNKRSNVYSRTKNQKLSASNINYVHNNTESSAYHSEYQNNLRKNTVNEIDNNKKNTNSESSPYRILKRNNTNIQNIETKGNKIHSVDCPEELHYFYIKIFQKGKKMNFDKNKIIKK